MECPQCHSAVEIEEMNIEPNEDQVEVNFKCPHCLIEQFALLGRFDFHPID